MSELEYHPLANIFPLMQGAEYEQLKADIQANGLLEPIYITENQIIDGRNRYRACMDIGIEPEFKTRQGDNLLNFIISKNLHRRHLTTDQREMIAVELANMQRGGDRPSENDSNFDSANLPIGNIPQSEAAKSMKVKERGLRKAKALKKANPELAQKVKDGELTRREAEKELRNKEIAEARAEVAKAGEAVKPDDRWRIYQGDIATWQAPRQYDFIITDPPYPKEFLPLWETLAKRASEWLKPGGLLIAMSGQSYLDEIYRLLSKHLEYYWTGCYLTPGQATPLRQVNVNTTWKPLLIYSLNGAAYKGKIFGDVFKSGGCDKDFHKWGQSESGMYDIVSKICLPGQYILDPFCGAGTTGIAALRHGCLFDGLELDEENVNISKGRLNDTNAI